MVKDFIKRNFTSLYKLYLESKISFLSWVGRYNRLFVIKYWYKSLHGKSINLENPVDFDEKINWLKLYSDTSLWSRCADKYAVRDYVSQCGLAEVLNELYGVYNCAEDINFDVLPDSFVIKTTNGGGGNSVMIVRSKRDLDVTKAVKTLNKWLKKPTSFLYGEYHYSKIKPRLIVEKYLKPDEGEDSLTDIKINCFDGKPYSVFYCSDRHFGESVCYSVYDLDWKLHPQLITPDHRTEKIYPRPKSFDLMIEYSKVLSKGIPFVRVDWYEIDGKPVFSELTFTPGAGFQTFYTQDYLIELGNQLKLPKK